ncbi:Oidioi.mRNA.OKI2018_I69.chr2.g8257.t1.cds [Oikopleura dioica]|uniref:Oidioi.mRNA.OKI2018_I69.chr2.g8257.t1.cds n=1 Tax=Oikopleura dioica TaxID=34765 RepID=A0ABN7TEX3_OIKDI|nr:Oidioi.mRNA.OKI2018_I69.chr2.g8257.t1.cds [Oikopleura dioica]
MYYSVQSAKYWRNSAFFLGFPIVGLAVYAAHHREPKWHKREGWNKVDFLNPCPRHTQVYEADSNRCLFYNAEINWITLTGFADGENDVTILRNEENGEVRHYPYLSEVEKTDLRWDALGASQLEPLNPEMNYKTPEMTAHLRRRQLAKAELTKAPKKKAQKSFWNW